jgi:hypothetical protein
MKFFAILIGFALILATSSSSEEDDDSLISIMVKILNVKLDEDEIPLDQIPPNNPKSTTLSVTPEIMKIVQEVLKLSLKII